jgi:hypothetical protein
MMRSNLELLSVFLDSLRPARKQRTSAKKR